MKLKEIILTHCSKMQDFVPHSDHRASVFSENLTRSSYIKLIAYNGPDNQPT